MVFVDEAVGIELKVYLPAITALFVYFLCKFVKSDS